MAKRSIAATAKSLTVNFGKLALDAQRVALMEMVKVYERAARSTKKAGKLVPDKGIEPSTFGYKVVIQGAWYSLFNDLRKNSKPFPVIRGQAGALGGGQVLVTLSRK